MEVIQCDRCKAIYHEKELKVLSINKEDKSTVDLCNDCIASLEKWLRKNKDRKKSKGWSPESRARASERMALRQAEMKKKGKILKDNGIYKKQKVSNQYDIRPAEDADMDCID